MAHRIELIQIKKDGHVIGYERVPKNDEDSFLKALAHQPICVTVDPNSEAFKDFNGGIFYGPNSCEEVPNEFYDCERQVMHDMIAVGYGRDNSGEEYILLKNSWGTWWGEGGYMRIARSNGKPGGVCGLYDFPIYPTIDS